MHIKAKYSWFKHLDFMIIDLISLLVAFVISYALKFGSMNFLQSDSWSKYVIIISLVCIIITFIVNPYSGIFRRRYYQEIIKSLQFTIYNLLGISVILYTFKSGEIYSREVTIWMYMLYFPLSLSLKYIWKKLLVSGKVIINTTKQISLFIIASSDNFRQTIRNVMAGDLQLYDIKGISILGGSNRKNIDIDNDNSGKTIPVIEDYISFILNNNISDVLIAADLSEISEEVYKTLSINGVGVNLVVDNVIGFQSEDQYIQNFGVYKALSINAFSFTPGQVFYLGIKRVVDVIASLVGIVFLVPISIVVKLIYVLSGDNASIFYRQNRIGENGRKIKIWKFRSMVPNADAVLKDLLKNPEYKRQWEENQKLDNDPRITKAGHILRITSIDELPQLVNVLIGDMSLVGPRPLVEGELEEHGGLKLYQKVRPGITGWWGCSGRSNVDYRERLELEYYYVKNCSLYLDILCIFRTVFAVLKREGAQ